MQRANKLKPLEIVSWDDTYFRVRFQDLDGRYVLVPRHVLPKITTKDHFKALVHAYDERVRQGTGINPGEPIGWPRGSPSETTRVKITHNDAAGEKKKRKRRKPTQETCGKGEPRGAPSRSGGDRESGQVGDQCRQLLRIEGPVCCVTICIYGSHSHHFL